MLLRTTLTSLTALVLLAGPALSMTITNRDTAEHKVTIVAGDKSVEHTIAAEGTLEDACADGCKVSMAGSDQAVDATADDELEIKDGKVKKSEE